MPCSSGWYSTNGIGAVSLRNGVPDSSRRRVARRVRLAQRVAPAERVAAVVHLVEDDERPRVLDQPLVHGCLHRDLRVRHRDAVVVPRRARSGGW